MENYLAMNYDSAKGIQIWCFLQIVILLGCCLLQKKQGRTRQDSTNASCLHNWERQMHPDISDEVLHKFFASLVLKAVFFLSTAPLH